MRVQDIMNRKVETVSPEDGVVFANELMWRRCIHHLVVVEGDRVVGVLSDTDLGGPNAPEISDSQRIRDGMTADPVTVAPAVTVDRAVNILWERGIHCLPVLDGQRLVGIVTSTDIENLAKRGTSNRRYAGTDAQP